MLVPFDRRVRHREPDTAAHGFVWVETAPVLARRRRRPRLEPIRQQRVILPLRRQIHRRNPARPARFPPFERELACARPPLRAETGQRVARRKRLHQRRRSQRLPSAQVSDLHVQRLATIHVCQFILSFPARVTRTPRPARQISPVEVLDDMLRPLSGDFRLVTLPRHPLALDLVKRRLPGRQPQRQQIAAFLQVSHNRRRGRHRQRARPGQHQQVVTSSRQERRVSQDGRADELGRVPGGLHLPTDLPGEDFIEARQMIREYRRS